MSVTNSRDARAHTSVDVAIIGAGIGGLAAANAFKNVGIDAHVFERAQKVREIGGAVVIREPSLKLFESWNIATPFFGEAVKVDVLDVRDSHGNAMGTRPTDFANDGLAYSIHRADVHKLLVDGVAPGKVHLGMECVAVTDGSDYGVLTFADGSEVQAKVVIGADGINLGRATVGQRR